MLGWAMAIGFVAFFFVVLVADFGRMDEATDAVRLAVAAASTLCLLISVAYAELAWWGLRRENVLPSALVGTVSLLGFSLAAIALRTLASHPSGAAMRVMTFALVAWTLASSYCFMAYAQGASVLGG